MAFGFDLITQKRLKMGLIVLQTDETIETEFRGYLPPHCDLYHTRIACQPDVTAENLMQMKADLPAAASAFPANFDLDVMGYACTSGTSVIGPKNVESCIRAIHPRVKVSTPLTAITAALTQLGVKRIGFVSPYILPVSQIICDYLSDAGFYIASLISFEQQSDRIVAQISPDSVLKAVIKAAETPVDAVCISCTNLHSFSIINAAEAAIGKPVISSNQAMLWHMMQLGDVHLSDMQKPDMQKPDMQKPDMQKPDMQKPDMQIPDIQNSDLQKTKWPGRLFERL